MPSQLKNGYFEFSDIIGKHDVGSTVTYNCDREFELSDNKLKTRRCQEDKQWLETAPTCTRKQFANMLHNNIRKNVYSIVSNCGPPTLSENSYY